MRSQSYKCADDDDDDDKKREKKKFHNMKGCERWMIPFVMENNLIKRDSFCFLYLNKNIIIIVGKRSYGRVQTHKKHTDYQL